MKKIFTLLFLTCALFAQGKTYTLADLASLVGTINNSYESGGTTITETVGVAVVDGKYVITLPTGLASGVSGITFDGGNIVLSKSYLTINGDLQISNGETLLFDKKAQIEIKGSISAEKATFGAVAGAETGTNGAKGFRIIKEGAEARFYLCTFDYVGITYGNGIEEGSLMVAKCVFNNHNAKSGNAAINFTSKSKDNEVESCTFNNPELSAVQSGANVACGIVIHGNTVNKTQASNRLYPAINMSATGPYDIYIDGNKIHGPAAETRSGGIALSCLLGNPPTGQLYVRDNFVENCSYGITLTGPGSVRMERNIVRNNKYINNPNNGGSGINITCNSSGEGIIAKAYLRENRIEGNLWGVTVIGNVDINAGKTEDQTADDYNPGENVFINNGNNAPYEKCDWYNNTTATSYAQGNLWNVETQDAEHIAAVIVDKADDASLGEVIYMPAFSGTKTYMLADLERIVGTINNSYESGGTTVTETIGVSYSDGKYALTLPTGLASGVSGITFDGGNIILSKSYLTVNGDMKIIEGETLLFDKKAQLELKGNISAEKANFGTVAGAETGTNGAKGFRIIKEGANARFYQCTFDYVGITYGNGIEEGSLDVEHCVFNNHNTKSGNAAISFTSKSQGNFIGMNTFNNPELSAVQSGANVACGILILGNTVNKTQASNRLYPAINMSATGPYDIYIDGNKIHGPAAETRSGGIALSCLLGNPPTGQLYVRDNYVEDCSYGITLTGPGNVRMENNKVINNKYIANPNNGGSGINITCNSSGEGIIAKAYLRGNHIEGNLWGVTVIGNVDINAGKTEDPTAEDYNPGKNVFRNNGNNAPYEKCDWYNNTTATSYAQGNMWGVDVQDAENIEKVIVHKTDDATLGEVIYMPADTSTGIDNLKNDVKGSSTRYNIMGQPVNNTYRGIVIQNGKKVLVK